MSGHARDKRSSERREVKEVVEMSPDQARLTALSCDFSETGVQLRTRSPLRLWLRMSSLGETFVREAELAWVRKEPDGSMTYGLKLVE